MRRASPRATEGFTLIEMMITITVAVILMAVAVPSFRQLIADQRIKTASFDLFSALSYARNEAVKRNAPVTLKAGAVSDGAWTTGWRLVDPADSTKSLRSWNAITNLTVTEKVSGLSAVTFDLSGRVTTVVPKLEISSAIPLSVPTLRCIRVDTSGRAITTTGACP